MKRKGFTLIELVVVIALIAILAVTLAPRLRDQLAKAKDAKSIAVLGSLRTQSEIYYAERGETPVAGETASGAVGTAAHEAAAIVALRDSLDNSAQKLFDEAPTNADATPRVPIGGSRSTASADPTYGGDIGFTFTDPETSAASSDGISIWFSTSVAAGAGSGNTFDTIAKDWASY